MRRRVFCNYDCVFVVSIFLNLVFLQTILLQKAVVPNDIFYKSQQHLPSRSRISSSSKLLSCSTDKNNRNVLFDSSAKNENYPGCNIRETAVFVQSLKSKEQSSEITPALFDHLGHGTKFYVEISPKSSSQFLRDKHAWKGKEFFYGRRNNESQKIQVRIDNAIETFQNAKIPPEIDFLSIEADFWLLKTVLEGGYKPRVVRAQFNKHLAQGVYFDFHDGIAKWSTCEVSGCYASLTISLREAQDPQNRDVSNFFGASVLSFAKIGKTFGYNLVFIEAAAQRLYFVLSSEMGGVDLELVKWVEKLAEGTQIAQDVANTNLLQQYEHVCMGHEPCSDSFKW